LCTYKKFVCPVRILSANEPELHLSNCPVELN
jgi:hypothetical protein